MEGLLIGLIVVIGAGLVWGLLQQQRTGELVKELKGVLDGLFRTETQARQEISNRFETALGILHHVRGTLEARQKLDDENRTSLGRLEAVITGAASKGAAGENILHEVLQQLPQEMLARRVRIGGGEVEYALRLTNQKLLPIDSKWGSTSLLEHLERTATDQERDRMREELDTTVVRHVLQVEKYIDPAVTVPWAVAAIPDAAYRVIRKAHIEAQRRHVFIISYSLAVPFLLSFFHLYMQQSRSVDVDQLDAQLADMERIIEQMNQMLENQIERAGKMIQNAAGDYRQLLGKLRGSVSSVRRPQEQLEEASYDRSKTT